MNETKCCQKCGYRVFLSTVCRDPSCNCHSDEVMPYGGVPFSEKPQPEKWDEKREMEKLYLTYFPLAQSGNLDEYNLRTALVKASQLGATAQKEQMLEVVRGMRQPDTMGHYGPNDQLHIQHNIGYNSALSDVEEKIKGL